jgi:cobalt/nickel transport system permease protein
MHMADALLSPAVGGAMWATTAGTIAFCSRKVRAELDDRRVPLMGVLGAFLFAAQMINFSIPATGSSGHLGGGLLLTILLGPHAAFLTVASVLVVQALFFADGGLLALGCNIFNLGAFPAFVAYPLVYLKIAGPRPTRPRLTVAAMTAAIAGLQLGALGVVLETAASGVSALPLTAFLAVMQPIHLAIGVVEGFVTAAIVAFVHKARPELIAGVPEEAPGDGRAVRRLAAAFLAVALLAGGIVSWFASKDPDGLEWAISRVTGREEFRGPQRGIHGALARAQAQVAFLPEYAFRKSPPAGGGDGAQAADKGNDPRAKAGTSLSGVVGGLITLAVAFLVGLVLKKKTRPA